MSAFSWAIVVILLVIFIIIISEAMIDRVYPYITTTADENEENIEYKIRDIIYKNPSHEIIVINKTHCRQTDIILEKLERDFSNLHIIDG